MTVDYNPVVITGPARERPAPILAFTRKYGWVVCIPQSTPKAYGWAYTRPGGVRLDSDDVLATAELPPAPDSAR